MNSPITWPKPGKHTRIFALTPEHLDELLRRRLARQDAAQAQRQDRMEYLRDAIRDQRGHEWGSVGMAQAMEEELDRLYSTEPEEYEAAP